MSSATRSAVLCLALLLTAAYGKDSLKGVLPQALLRARTVAVLIDPDAGVVLTDPPANQVARRDVEQALQNWGRYTVVYSPQEADLIVVLRRGHGKIVEPTIANPRQNDRPGNVTPTDNGVVLGAQRGRGIPVSRSDAHPAEPSSSGVEATSPDDVFAVYTQDSFEKSNPLDAPAAWRYIAKNALKPHAVPAVDEFRKAVAVADQIAAKHP